MTELDPAIIAAHVRYTDRAAECAAKSKSFATKGQRRMANLYATFARNWIAQADAML